MVTEPMVRLRRIVAAAERGEPVLPVDAAWFARCFGEYEADDGAKLDQVLGLVPAPGCECWRTVERRRRRDGALRELRSTFFQDLDIAPAAREIEKLARRHRATPWSAERDKATGPAASARRLLSVALGTGLPMPRDRRLRDILAKDGNELPVSKAKSGNELCAPETTLFIANKPGETSLP
jgi:hypothetical protein